MAQNGELSTGLERLTNALFTGAESEDAASALQNEIIPLSTQLATSIVGVATTNPTIAATHAYIVDGWTQRKEAHMEMLQAYRSSDLALFDSATQKAATARENEERYFLEINAFLAPYGLYITQHPE